ncbi:MAG: hypothetical protein QXP20_01570 [Candidatus Bathyarchaeia archaeon]
MYSSGLCEVCHGEKATLLCPRCRRLVCKGCWSNAWQLCSDCGSFKETLESDRARIIDYMQKQTQFMKQLCRKKECELCPVFRELALVWLKTTKDIEHEATREGFELLKKKVAKLRQDITEICILLLVKQSLYPSVEGLR